MSVLIRGMKMPECCGDCELLYDYSDCMVTGRTVWKYPYTGEMVIDLEEERLPNCPLVEVKTPHGRLIDGDEMVSQWKGCTFEGDITCLLDPWPTVLGPEE